MSWDGKIVTLFDKLSIDEANKVIDKRRRNFHKTEGVWRCKKCSGGSKVTTLQVSDKVVLIPFCPSCEGSPKMFRGFIRKD